MIAVGKVRKRWIQDGLEVYLKRLPGLVVSELKDSNPQREAEAILVELRPEERLVVLCEEGELLASEALAERLQGKIVCDFDTARRIFTLVTALHWKG